MSDNISFLRDQGDWDKNWSDLFDHYQKDLRHAYYIRALKRKNERKILEIGAGSFRDMAALRKWGISCNGVDFSTESVKRARHQFPNFKDFIHKMDAFSLDFNDETFDLTFHNGFWGYFSDEEIIKLAKEQARISKYRMFATVHNAHNIPFKKYFDKMKKTELLYNIRFFNLDEIASLMSKVCSKVYVLPVGKGKKYHEDFLIRMYLGHPIILKSYFSFSKHKFLAQSERLICIGEL